MLTLDHILWGAPDLEAGMSAFERLTGVAASVGGSHPGAGTRNALSGLGEGLYFEIIAPDPAQELVGNRGAELAGLPRPGLYAFALRSNDLEAVASRARQAGAAGLDPVRMGRRTPDGLTIEWGIFYFRHEALGGQLHFALDWGSTPHPSLAATPGCSLAALTVLRRDPRPLTRLYEALGVPVAVEAAAIDGMRAELDTPHGRITLREPHAP